MNLQNLNQHESSSLSEEDVFVAPASFSQQRLWFIQQLQPDSSAYNVPAALRLNGNLDLNALEQSLGEIVRRHEVLRTTFGDEDGQLLQFISHFSPLTRPHIKTADLTQLAAAAREAEVQRLAREEARRPFDLSRGPLLRVTLLRLAPEDHVLLFTMHHIISDGWSVDILLEELSTLYTAFSAGKPSPLPELAIQYSDYAVWQQQRLQGSVLERQIAYWQEQLSGAPDLLELPTDHPRPTTQTFRGRQINFAISRETTTAIQALCQQTGTTPFMLLLAAFNVLLYRYTGQPDILVGSPIANRQRSEIQALIGFLVNTLILRTRLTGEMRFRDLLAQVRQTSIEAFANQDVPFEILVERLQQKRRHAYNPFFQVMFLFQSARRQSFKLPGLVLSDLDVESDGAKLDLSLLILERAQNFDGVVEFNTDLFAPATIERMIRHFELVLEGIVADPERRISEIALLSEAEHRLLRQWNDTLKIYPQDRCVYQVFEDQVEKTPDLLAIRDGTGRALSYRELNERANRLAHYLSALGVEPGMRVGFYLERSAEVAVGLLGVWKAGGVYVPLEPSYPRDRLAYMLKDAQVEVLLTQSSLRTTLPEHRARVVNLDLEWAAIAQQSARNPDRKGRGDQLAYLIYTSGTTGWPKAVMVGHDNLSNVILTNAETFGFTEGGMLPCLAPFVFDISLFELLLPLITGSCVLVLSREQILETEQLVEHLKDATALHMVPSLMGQLLKYQQSRVATDHHSAPSLDKLRHIFVGGDAVAPELLRQMREVFPAAHLHVLYGPTEATIICTSHLVEQLPAQQVIGRPLPNMRVSIRDQHGQLMPVGVAGELYLAGAGVTRGYLNQPELTSQKYVTIDGARWYKTGDRALWLENGTIQFLGRLDDQTKIRGFRVELGEVEAALRSLPEVAEAVVMKREDHPDDPRLVAYVVLRSGAMRRDTASAETSFLGGAREIEMWPSTGEYPIYDELIYHGLTNDEPRNLLYQQVIEREVKDRVVIDIGTGSDAILAQMCIEAGARKVYAVEMLERSYLQAKHRLESLRLTDRITLIHGDATSIELPEQCDVCVSEIFEAIGGAEGAAVILNGTRRLLSPGAVTIPEQSLTRVAAIRLPEELYGNPSFTEVSGHYVEKIFEAVGHKFDLRLSIKNFPASHIISSTDIFEELDFSSYVAPNFRREIRLFIEEDSRLDGFLAWLHLRLDAQTTLDIQEGQYAWFPTIFPVFYPGLEVRRGDRIEAVCAGHLSDDGVHPDYSLTGHVRRQNGETTPFEFASTHHQRQYRSNAFYDRLFSGDLVPKRASRGDLRIEDLREHLNQRLPDFMLPSAFVLMDELPLSPNGKVDRRALPAPENVRPALKRQFVAPTTEIERAIAEAWQEVLGIERVGLYDNFFDLGAHSLTVVRVHGLLQKHFGKEIPLVDMFKHSTASALAKYINSEQPSEKGAQAGQARADMRLSRRKQRGRN